MNLPSNSLFPVFHFFLLRLCHCSAAQQFLNSQPFPSCLPVPLSDACSISIIITVSGEKRPAGLKRHGHHKGSGMSGSRARRSVRGMAFTFQKRQTKWTPALVFFLQYPTCSLLLFNHILCHHLSASVCHSLFLYIDVPSESEADIRFEILGVIRDGVRTPASLVSSKSNIWLNRQSALLRPSN